MAVLKVTFYTTRDASLMANSLKQKLVEKGNIFLRPHRLKFDVAPFGLSEPVVVDFTGKIRANGWQPPPWESDKLGIEQRRKLGQAVHGPQPTKDGRLKVVFANIEGNGSEAVGSLGGQPNDWQPWVLIAIDTKHPDGLTLVHEAGHCAGLPHVAKDDLDNIMGYGLNRTLILEEQLAKYRSAFFHAAI